MKKYKTVPDADLSSAGDDFHILWAMKKSLELLNFDEEGLKKVVIEGIEKKMSIEADPTGEKLLGVDLTEYYGGKDFSNAKKIIISQLKYSTRRSDVNYTFGRLYKGKKSQSYEGSIIHRLASAFQVFIENYPREKVLEKLKIKLVSNREFNKSHLNQIEQIQDFLSTNKREISITTVLKKLSINDAPFIKMRKASGLKVKEFSDFIRVLNFDDCGVESRQKLNFQLINNISNKSKNAGVRFNSLFQELWQKVMPESEDWRGIIDKDILAAFGFSSLEDLFPVSQDFENIAKTVPREQLNKILQKINNNNTNKPICIHGGAGYGKSVFIRQLKNAIPDYSHCILFDCYGNGKYQNPEDKRHLYRNAIPQLANTLSKVLGTELLLERNATSDEYLRQFKKQIKKGVQILRDIKPKSNLIFIVDAADNSMTAAEAENEKSFVEGLVNMEIPYGCQIVVTSRTHRKDSLQLPDGFIDISLNSFNLKESRKFLRNKFPDAREDQVQDFYKLTNGIARVQSYALNLFDRSLEEILNELRPDGKDVNDLINKQIAEAKKRLGKTQEAVIDQFLKYLITLPRPVPKSYLSEIINVDSGFLEDLSTDVWAGLRFENKRFSFKDEDFENYVRDKFEVKSKEERKRIAEVFIVKAESDEYASINLGSILFNADLHDRILDIVLNKKLLNQPNDPIRKQEVYLTRIQLALKIAAGREENITYTKLLFIAAEESKSNMALSQLLEKHPDLITKYGDEVSLSKFKVEYRGQSWAGRFNLKLAANFSRGAEKDKATKYLKISKEWLEWRNKKTEEELEDFPIFVKDISLEVETVLRMQGVAAAMKTLHRWKPRNIRLPVADNLVKNIISFSSLENIEKWSSFSAYRIDEKIFLVTKLYRLKKEIGFNLSHLAKYFLNIIRRKRIKFSEEFNIIIIEFCGVLARYEIDSEIIRPILDCINVSSLETIPYFFNNYNRGKEKNSMEVFLYKETIIASLKGQDISLDSLYPKRFKKNGEEKDYKKRISLEREKEEFRKFYQYALTIYQIQADFLTKRYPEKDIGNSLRKICSKITADNDFKNVFRFRADDPLLYLVTKLIDIALLLDKSMKVVDAILDSFDKEVSQIKIRFVLLERLVNYKEFNDKSLKILSEAQNLIEESNSTANELIENYLNCLILGDRIGDNSGFGEYFFRKIIESTSEIDYSALAQIKCLNSFSKTGISTSNPQLAYEYSRFVEFADIKLAGYDKKHFPYLESLLTVGELHLPSVFSIACRWDHRDVYTLNDLIVSLGYQSLEKKFVSHSVAASLLRFQSTRFRYDDLEKLYGLIVYMFDKEENVDKKTTFLKNTLKTLRLKKDEYFIDLIYERIKSGKLLRKEVLSDYEEYRDFIHQFKDNKETTPYKVEGQKERACVNIDHVIYTETESLETVVKNILDNEEVYNSNLEIENIFDQILNGCERKNATDFLDAFVDIDSNLLNIYPFKSILRKCLDKWSYLPAVKTWATENFSYIIRTRISSFEQGYYFDLGSLFKIADTLSIDDEVVVDVMRTALPQRIQYLSDETIYSALEFLNGSLSKAENEELFKWILQRWNSKIKDNVADGKWDKNLCPPSDSNENTANLLKYFLGHPYKANRWRAIHTIKELSNFGNTDILKLLINTQNNKDCGTFQDRKQPFYWMSAKLYLWIAIEGISKENPDLLLPFAQSFHEILLEDNLKHVLIREFVKRSCLNLFAWDATIYTSEEYQYISKVNISSLKPVKEERFSRKQRRYAQNSGEIKWRFPFNSLDTLPYWFSPLGRVFNLSSYDVADIADKIIVEEWGYDGNPYEDDFIRNQLNHNEWGDTRNNHGANPKIEGLLNYYEYHTMFCAANYLLKREPELEDDSYYNNFGYWLNSESTAFNDFWLSDLRDPVPLESEYWKKYNIEFNEKWRDSIPDDMFDEQIGFSKTNQIKYLNLFGGTKKLIGQNEESVTIRSALISNETSEALLRALHSVKNSMNYYIPTAGKEETLGREKVEEKDFTMTGWLQEISSVEGELDSHDPFFNGIEKSYIRFKSSIEKVFDVKYDNLYKKSFCQGRIISILQNWNEITDNSYKYSIDEVESSGFIFKVEVRFLLEVLRNQNKSLLVSCKVNRQLQERKYVNYNEDDRNQLKLYLIKPNGKVKTLRGESYKIG